MDVHREFAQLAVSDGDLVHDEDWIRVTLDALRASIGVSMPVELAVAELGAMSPDRAAQHTVVADRSARPGPFASPAERPF